MDITQSALIGLIRSAPLLIPIALPVVLVFLSSTYDDTYKARGRLSAKLCFSGLSFDVWGLTTILRNQASLGAPPAPLVSREELGLSLLFMMFLHMMFNVACLKLSTNSWILVRSVFVSLSLLVPLLMLFPTSLF